MVIHILYGVCVCVCWEWRMWSNDSWQTVIKMPSPIIEYERTCVLSKLPDASVLQNTRQYSLQKPHTQRNTNSLHSWVISCCREVCENNSAGQRGAVISVVAPLGVRMWDLKLDVNVALAALIHSLLYCFCEPVLKNGKFYRLHGAKWRV